MQPESEANPGSAANAPPSTLFDKIWRRHLVTEPAEAGVPSMLYIDLHLLHEVTTPQAFAELQRRGLPVRCPQRAVATMDQSTPTLPGVGRSGLRVIDPRGADQLDQLEANCERHGIPLFALGDDRQGIVHVIGPELGLTQPGMTIVCGDSHTSTHGAFGALAFGIGSSEVTHVLATQCLLQQRPRTFEVHLEGELQHGATAKDLILGIIAETGVDGGTGHVIEYTGRAIRQLDMEGRMTVCNMSIEAGARAGLIAPDETTFSYLADRPYAPRAWSQAVADWRQLRTDPGAVFDRRITLDAAAIEPMITWGTHPGMSMPVSGTVPVLGEIEPASRPTVEKAWDYMAVKPGEALLGRDVDVVFVGSCTNSRLSDLEAAASILDGRQVASGVEMLVVPGSQTVRRQAEERGLHEVFLAAGAQWREAGCSMCLAMNGDRLAPGQLAVSTTNRNFEGRQGPGGRTVLASPLTAAASAVAGHITDPREML
ncbi:MAG: 3-isopropylmalate dehydratase large subunit [Acidobacteriota bacterium]